MNKVEFQKVMDNIYRDVCTSGNEGAVADYIPELSKVNPNKFGVCLRTVDDEVIGVGDWEEKFSIQSVSKVLAVSMAYQSVSYTHLTLPTTPYV